MSGEDELSCGNADHRVCGSGPTATGPLQDLGTFLAGYTRIVSTTAAPRGIFITLEGPDGSGKSSLMPRLAAVLAAGGCEVVTTREPGSTPLGEQMRRLVLDTEPPDRPRRPRGRPAVRRLARPARGRGHPARPRRAAPSCSATATRTRRWRTRARAPGVPMDELREVQHFATGGLVPDLTILLDLPVEVGLRPQVGRDHALRGVPGHRRTTSGCARRSWGSRPRSRIATSSWTRPASPTAVLAGAVEAVRRVAGRLPCLGAPALRAGRRPGARPARAVQAPRLRATSTIDGRLRRRLRAPRAPPSSSVRGIARRPAGSGRRAAQTVIVWPSTASSFAMPSSTRRATVTPAGPGATSTNSSPPVRAIVSTSRTLSASTRRHLAQDVVPGTRAPDAALSSRKPSTSNSATETSRALPLGARHLELQDPRRPSARSRGPSADP